ncbi:MAG: xylS [Paenibacillus sp.]|jgi:AraC-like DNA-binding protein|nr:xylS [Paenibacillus sp.]
MREQSASPTGLQFQLDNGIGVIVKAAAPLAFHVRLQRSRSFAEGSRIQAHPSGLAPSAGRFTAERTESDVYLHTDQASLQIDAHTGAFQLFTAERKLLLCTATPPAFDEASRIALAFPLHEPEELVGAGAACGAGNGLQLRGQRLTLDGSRPGTRPLWMMSSRGWALLVDSDQRVACDAGADGSRLLKIAADGSFVDLYICIGDSYSGLLHVYNALFGKPELLPLRAYGLSFVCGRSRSAREVIADALKFREADIPCDYIALSDDSPLRLTGPEHEVHSPIQPMSFIDTLHRNGFEISRRAAERREELDGEADRHRPFAIGEAIRYSGGVLPDTAILLRMDDREQPLSAVFELGLRGRMSTAIQMDLSSRGSIHASFMQAWTCAVDWHPALLDEPMQRLFRTYAKWRYRLLPYVYSVAHEAAVSGMPVVRAMPLMYPADPQCRELHRQFMIGDYLLTAAFATEVYLPAGDWIDYWTGQRVEGGRRLACAVPEEAGGPLFIRAGAILPCWPDIDHVGQYDGEGIQLHLYPHQASRFTLTEDDGVTSAYKAGRAATTEITCAVRSDDGHTSIRISPRSGEYSGMPAKRSYTLVIHTGRKPERLCMKGRALEEHKPRRHAPAPSGGGWQYDRQTGSVTLEVEETPQGGGLLIELEYAAAADRSANAGQASAAHPYDAEAGEADGNPPPQLLAGIYAALERGEPEPLQAALQAWWSDACGRSALPARWRMQLLEGAMIAIRHVERHGGHIERVFGASLSQLFMLRDVRTPEQGLELLRLWFQQSLQLHGEPVKPPLHATVRQAIALIERNPAQSLSLLEAARQIGVNSSYLSRLFSKETGQAYTDYALKHRMERAKELLQSGLKVHEAAAGTGFKDAGHFSRTFHKYWGQPPVHYKHEPE